MWWVVSLIALVVLLIAGTAVTIFIMIALNGFSDLPYAFAAIYLTFTCGLILALSLLAGLLARKLSATKGQPLWRTGTLTTLISLIIVPIPLCGFTYVLLVAFGLI